MSAERKKPGTLSGIAPEANPRHEGGVARPLPFSTLVSPPDSDDDAAFSSRNKSHPMDPPPRMPDLDPLAGEHRGPRVTSTGLSWKSLLGIDDPPASRGKDMGPRRPRSETRATAHGVASSAGYYSSRPAPEYVGTPRRSSSVAPKKSVPAAVDRASGLDLEPVDLGKVAGPTEGRRASVPAPRIFFPARVREQADGWLRSGSLSLPHCSSPRHARAVQRALLLALLAEPGYEALPFGLKQRVGWLFGSGWENASGNGSLSELDDLMTVLGVPVGAEASNVLLAAVGALIPDPLPSGRPPSSYPPVRR